MQSFIYKENPANLTYADIMHNAKIGAMHGDPYDLLPPGDVRIECLGPHGWSWSYIFADELSQEYYRTSHKTWAYVDTNGVVTAP